MQVGPAGWGGKKEGRVERMAIKGKAVVGKRWGRRRMWEMQAFRRLGLGASF